MKVLLDHHGVEGTTWELESDMRNKYPELFTGSLLEISMTKFLLGGEDVIPSTNELNRQ